MNSRLSSVNSAVSLINYCYILTKDRCTTSGGVAAGAGTRRGGYWLVREEGSRGLSRKKKNGRRTRDARVYEHTRADNEKPPGDVV